MGQKMIADKIIICFLVIKDSSPAFSLVYQANNGATYTQSNHRNLCKIITDFCFCVKKNLKISLWYLGTMSDMDTDMGTQRKTLTLDKYQGCPKGGLMKKKTTAMIT